MRRPGGTDGGWSTWDILPPYPTAASTARLGSAARFSGNRPSRDRPAAPPSRMVTERPPRHTGNILPITGDIRAVVGVLLLATICEKLGRLRRRSFRERRNNSTNTPSGGRSGPIDPHVRGNDANGVWLLGGDVISAGLPPTIPVHDATTGGDANIGDGPAGSAFVKRTDTEDLTTGQTPRAANCLPRYQMERPPAQLRGSSSSGRGRPARASDALRTSPKGRQWIAPPPQRTVFTPWRIGGALVPPPQRLP